MRATSPHHYHGWPQILRGSCFPSARLHRLQVRRKRTRTIILRRGYHPLAPLDSFLCLPCILGGPSSLCSLSRSPLLPRRKLTLGLAPHFPRACQPVLPGSPLPIYHPLSQLFLFGGSLTFVHLSAFTSCSPILPLPHLLARVHSLAYAPPVSLVEF